MKKTLTLMAAAAIMIVSCNKENEFHQTYIPQAYTIVYADQTADSIPYVTTEEHTLKSTGSWCSVNTDYQASVNSQIKKNPGIYTLVAYISCNLNTTGKLRVADFLVDSREYDASSIIVQLANLEVERPAITISQDLTVDSVSFMYLEGLANTDSIIFTTHYPWTLSVPEGSFITLHTTSGEAGRNIVKFDYTMNATENDRSTKITLTSDYTKTRKTELDERTPVESEVSGISTIIPIIQNKVFLPQDL